MFITCDVKYIVDSFFVSFDTTLSCYDLSMLIAICFILDSMPDHVLMISNINGRRFDTS